jgi:hypothetical protein
MKNKGLEYRLILVLMGLSAVASVLNIWKPELFSDTAKLVFRAILFGGFVWYLTRGKKLDPNG